MTEPIDRDHTRCPESEVPVDSNGRASRFSVVVPAYNASATLAETLDAVLDQSLRGWECVVVDDGSTDDTRELAECYARRDPRFTVVSQSNRGTGGAYNTGVRTSRGSWITICSADDLLLPTHLEVMGQTIDANPHYDIVSCNGRYLRPDGALDLVYTGEADRVSRSWSLEDLLNRCFFGVGACYRRSLFDSTGGYLEDTYGEDYDFWLRAMAAGARHLYIPRVLAVHRTSPTQKSANHVRAFESDIASIGRVLDSGLLTAHQRVSARTAIKTRRRMISEIVAPTRLSNRVRRRLRLIRGRIMP